MRRLLALGLGGCCALPVQPPHEVVEPTPVAPQAPSTGPVPLFVSPFRGEHPVTNFFDHNPSGGGDPLITTGQRAWGIESHRGYDFGMAEGTELFAMADGVVLRAGDFGPKRCTGGNRVPDNVQVWIRHDDTPDGLVYLSRLQHLSEWLVEPGDRVTQGQLVARSGNTGCSSGPHLHLEIVHVTDPETGKGWALDPYGWSGGQPDPRAEVGRPSPVMWLPGEAPPIRRVRKGMPGETELGPHRLSGTDGLDPIGGEWVDIGLRKTAGTSRSLQGLSLRNAAGDELDLPAVTLEPGRSLRVFTHKASPADGELSWQRESEAWDDLSDCAMLVQSDGTVVAALPFGRGPPRCP